MSEKQTLASSISNFTSDAGPFPLNSTFPTGEVNYLIGAKKYYINPVIRPDLCRRYYC
jgi:hypothetical protein